ncbi:MAG: hypothetical protein D6756_12030 [Cyanobacteria bacterium J083]|nr:MAG: hypothetical protein D6756_12030 [Cyanobacteria bacterium J083]
MILPIFPILFFLTAIISILLYLKTAQEVYGILAVSSTIVCFIWGLVIAHWSVHIVALILLLGLKLPEQGEIFKRQS